MSCQIDTVERRERPGPLYLWSLQLRWLHWGAWKAFRGWALWSSSESAWKPRRKMNETSLQSYAFACHWESEKECQNFVEKSRSLEFLRKIYFNHLLLCKIYEPSEALSSSSSSSSFDRKNFFITVFLILAKCSADPMNTKCWNLNMNNGNQRRRFHWRSDIILRLLAFTETRNYGRFMTAWTTFMSIALEEEAILTQNTSINKWKIGSWTLHVISNCLWCRWSLNVHQIASFWHQPSRVNYRKYFHPTIFIVSAASRLWALYHLLSCCSITLNSFSSEI